DRVLQMACVYGDLTARLNKCLSPHAGFDVIDVVPTQLTNLSKKLGPQCRPQLYLGDSASLGFADASYDAVLIFFLLHEVPEDVRRRTLSEAVRTVRAGGKIVIIDYHRPATWNPLRGLMCLVLAWLEPFALDL